MAGDDAAHVNAVNILGGGITGSPVTAEGKEEDNNSSESRREGENEDTTNVK